MRTTNRIRFAFSAAALSLILTGTLAARQANDTAQPEADTKPPTATNPDTSLAEDTNSTPPIPDDRRNIQTADEDETVHWRAPMIVIGRDAELKAGESVETVVVIGGSARIHGKVREAAVVIGGDLDVDGEVGEAAVAVLGNVNAKPGAKIRGDAVAVGGRVDVAKGAKVSRTAQGVELPDMQWLRSWFLHCVLLMRPLSLQVGWIWGIAGVVFLFYLLIAVVFPHPVAVCVNELTRRPATSFVVGLLTLLITPFAILLLAVTG